MELMREIEGMNPSIIDPKRLIEKLRSYLPAEREMIEEACIGFAKWIQDGTYARYESGVWHPFDTDQQPDTFTDAELYEYYLQTFKSNGDEK